MVHNYSNVMVESDSMVITDMINGIVIISVQVRHIIRDITQLKSQENFIF